MLQDYRNEKGLNPFQTVLGGILISCKIWCMGRVSQCWPFTIKHLRFIARECEPPKNTHVRRGLQSKMRSDSTALGRCNRLEWIVPFDVCAIVLLGLPVVQQLNVENDNFAEGVRYVHFNIDNIKTAILRIRKVNYMFFLKICSGFF